MKTAVITGKTDVSSLVPLFERLQALLKQCGWDSFIIAKGIAPTQNFDLAFSIGGDGSFLSTCRSLARFNKPIISIYAGNLGFLPSISPETLSLEVLTPFLEDTYPWMHRLVLQGHCSCQEKLFALNEFYFTNDQKGSLSDYIVMIDGVESMKVRADGLIISTPTGSTAYNLSAGGPILMPSMQAIVITPVCSHILGERPLVFGLEHTISIINHNKRSSQVWADGQEMITLNNNEAFSLSTPMLVHTMRADPHQFFNSLSVKLGWNMSPKEF
ncbi:MAG: NAD(+)/NADH kinase [Brevinema sp.]